jgi:hypothetical protein
MNKYVAAPMVGHLKWITYIAVALAAILITLGIPLAWQDAIAHRTLSAVAHAGISIVLACFVVYSWLMRPVQYEVDDDSLKILTAARVTQIPLSAVTGVRRYQMSKQNLLSMWLYGEGGIFSYRGRRPIEGLGTVAMTVTDRSRAVLIDAESKYLISPADPDAFIADVTNRLGKPAQARRRKPRR